MLLPSTRFIDMGSGPPFIDMADSSGSADRVVVSLFHTPRSYPTLILATQKFGFDDRLTLIFGA